MSLLVRAYWAMVLLGLAVAVYLTAVEAPWWLAYWAGMGDVFVAMAGVLTLVLPYMAGTLLLATTIVAMLWLLMSSYAAAQENGLWAALALAGLALCAGGMGAAVAVAMAGPWLHALATTGGVK